jgi:hypothetical protein
MRCRRAPIGAVLTAHQRNRSQRAADWAPCRVVRWVVAMLELELRTPQDQATGGDDCSRPVEPCLTGPGRVVPLAVARALTTHPAIHHRDPAPARLAARPRETSRPLQRDNGVAPGVDRDVLCPLARASPIRRIIPSSRSCGARAYRLALVLNGEDGPEGNDRGRGVDEELNLIRELKDWPGHRPDEQQDD